MAARRTGEAALSVRVDYFGFVLALSRLRQTQAHLPHNLEAANRLLLKRQMLLGAAPC
jgi:hypothetical protein